MQLTKSRNVSPPDPTNDNGNADLSRSPLDLMHDGIMMGLSFYSRLPVGTDAHSKFDFAAMVRPLAFASLTIGIIPVAFLLVLSLFGPSPLFAAIVAVAVSAIVTGAMAEDAFADAMDGLFGGQTLERKLEIMHDSRHGTYGVLGIVAPFTLRVVILATLATQNPIAAAALWLSASVLARSGATYIAYALPAARKDGISAGAGILPRTACFIGIGLAIAISIILCVPFGGIIPWLIALLVGAGTLFGCKALLKRMLGGQTGDTIGATQLTLEIAILSSFMLSVGL